MPLNQQITINVANEVVGINVKIINIPEDSLRLTLTEQVELSLIHISEPTRPY